MRTGFSTQACAIMSAASSGVMVGKRSYIFVGLIIGVRTNGMKIEAATIAREALRLLEALPPSRRSVASVTQRESRLRAMLAPSP